MRYVTFFAVIACITIAGCANSTTAKQADTQGESTPNASIATGNVPDAIVGIDWLLVEIRQGDTVTGLDRVQLAAEDMGDVFTLRFDGEGRASGKAAPNRYTAPCELDDSGAISFGLAAATKMLAFREPEALKEREFFAYLTRVNRWALDGDGRLELYAAAVTDGGAAVLVFNQ